MGFKLVEFSLLSLFAFCSWPNEDEGSFSRPPRHFFCVWTLPKKDVKRAYLHDFGESSRFLSFLTKRRAQVSGLCSSVKVSFSRAQETNHSFVYVSTDAPFQKSGGVVA